ncbi:UDP-glucose/GDP-mannose dehydrogenase family protein [Candidatus Uhrbacteria bacterium]|nr:UDP-glucose/GDP-mannose dehydrogenase family protein [Candidatus Uhrbacteria bacterium]
MKPACSVVGLGKLGSSLAACLASSGFKVFCFDIKTEILETLKKGQAPAIETGLQELITKSQANLIPVFTPKEIIENSDVTFLVLPTPSNLDGSFSDEHLRNALSELGSALATKNKYHLFAITSTVSPGSCEKSLIPTLEKASGKKFGHDFGLCYNPEFIALGEVIKGLLNPDLVLIGESHTKDGDQLAEIYKDLCPNNPQISRMSLVSAEITKIAINAYVTTKISFANFLGNICERTPGAEIDQITAALGHDRRISPYYLKAGPPFSGPCFPRDNKAFFVFAQNLGLHAYMARATDDINDFQIENLLETILSHPPEGHAISILGLAYKMRTAVLDESPMVKLIQRVLFKEPDTRFTVYDKLAADNLKKLFGNKINYAGSITECLEASSYWILGLPEKEFKAEIENSGAAAGTLLDCWRFIDQTKLSKNIKYLGLGQNHE